MERYHAVGTVMPNDQAYGKITGQAKYIDDIQTPGMLHVKLKHSTVAHAYIRAVHTEKAEALDGVIKVYSCRNTDMPLFDRGQVQPWEEVPDQEPLFTDHVRFFGERVAAVAAVTPEIAQKACDLIEVEYEPLPAALTMDEAEKPDAPLLHPDGNVYEAESVDVGDYDAIEGAIVTRSHLECGRMTHLIMEPEGCRARYDRSEQTLTVWTPCQSVFGVRNTVASLLNLPSSRVRVVKMLMGGSFGVRQEAVLEPVTAYIAYDLKADVKLIYTREEQTVNTLMKHSLTADVESKVTTEGKILGLSLTYRLDAGAYLTISRSYCGRIGHKSGKVYDIPNVRYRGRAICTNTPVNGSFRSWGSNELCIGLEKHWNKVAKSLGIDPVAFRLMNVHKPYETDRVNEITVGNSHFEEVIEKGRDSFDWDRRRKLCQEKNERRGRYRYGMGVSVISHTSSFYPGIAEMAISTVRLQEDGSLLIHATVHDHGCGTVLAVKKIASEVTGIGVEKIMFREADTQNDPYDYGCFGSRTIYTIGEAVRGACAGLMDLASKRAAMMLGLQENVMRFDGTEFYAECEPQKRATLMQVAEFSIRQLAEDVTFTYNNHAKANPGVPAAFFALVRVDTYTGFTKVLDCLSVHDVGKAINPDLCMGQVGSGVQQGIGQALCEEIKISPATGETLVPNLKDYEAANAAVMPSYRAIFIEEPEPGGPFGAKSIGEVTFAPVGPGIAGAVNDALGTDIDVLPITPAVVLEALADKK